MRLQYIRHTAALVALCLGSPGLWNTALAQESEAEAPEAPRVRAESQLETREQGREQAREQAPLAVTMRIIEDPEAIGADAVTRRISLPPAAEVRGLRDGVGPSGMSEQATERGREFGEEVAERAREMREKASENRENFGRSRAEQMRPELPERPEPPRPPRP